MPIRLGLEDLKKLKGDDSPLNPLDIDEFINFTKEREEYEGEAGMLNLWKSFGERGLEYWTVPDLKTELKMRGLKLSGKKNDLIARLAFALRDEEKTLESKRKAFEDLSKEESPTKKVHIEDQDYIVKFTLPRHACFRVLSVPGKMKFLDALEGILESFGFDIDHLFVIRRSTGVIRSEWERDCVGFRMQDRDEGEVMWSDVPVNKLKFSIGDKMGMEYDFGSPWHFGIEILDIVPATGDKVKVIKSQGKPPEQY